MFSFFEWWSSTAFLGLTSALPQVASLTVPALLEGYAVVVRAMGKEGSEGMAAAVGEGRRVRAGKVE